MALYAAYRIAGCAAAGSDLILNHNLCFAQQRLERIREALRGRVERVMLYQLADADGVDRVFRERDGRDAKRERQHDGKDHFHDGKMVFHGSFLRLIIFFDAGFCGIFQGFLHRGLKAVFMTSASFA